VRDWSKANLTSETKMGRVYHLLRQGWRSIRHADRRDVLTFSQRVSELRDKVGPARGFRVESRWEPKSHTPPGWERVKEHQIVWRENGGA
jgi:hypothetical protein